MKLLYLDAASGVSGNMWLSGLIHLGLPGIDTESLHQALHLLPIDLPSFTFVPRSKQGIWGLYVDPEEPLKAKYLTGEVSYLQLVQWVESAKLPRAVQTKSLAMLERFAVTKQQVESIPMDQILFSYWDGLDLLVDVVGNCFLMQRLIEQVRELRVMASSIPIGEGDGVSPVTLSLLQGVPVYMTGVKGVVFTTVTGALLLKEWVHEFSTLREMRLEKVGIGVGSSDFPHPNVLKFLWGEMGEHRPEGETMTVVETNIDDMNPEFYEYVQEKLFQVGAKEVYWTAVGMKKNRPGVCLSVLAPAHEMDAVLAILFEETTAIGVRFYEVARRVLVRRQETVNLTYGVVSVKIAYLEDRVVNIQPEYEDCRRLATAMGYPLKQVYEEAKTYAMRRFLS